MTKQAKNEKKPAAIVPLETEVIRASVPLSDHEVLNKSRQMADKMRQAEELKDCLKTYNTQEKAKISQIEASVNVLREEIGSGSEIRDVECEIVKDSINKERLWRSKQTFEILKREPFRKEDYQLDMNDEAEAMFPEPEETPAD